MTRKEREHFERLERRRDHLAERLATYDRAGDPSHTRAELGAIRWALTVIQNAESHGILHDLASVTR